MEFRSETRQKRSTPAGTAEWGNDYIAAALTLFSIEEVSDVVLILFKAKGKVVNATCLRFPRACSSLFSGALSGSAS